MDDKELKAMAAINDALKDLNEDERFRAMQWAYGKYPPMKEAEQQAVQTPQKLLPGDTISAPVLDDGEDDFQTFAEMLDASGATTESERFLIAAYWLLKNQAQVEFRSNDVTKVLKDTGYQMKSVSNATKALKNSKPTRIVQVSQSKGKVGKGHISFKLTSNGVKEAEAMLSGCDA